MNKNPKISEIIEPTVESLGRYYLRCIYRLTEDMETALIEALEALPDDAPAAASVGYAKAATDEIRRIIQYGQTTEELIAELTDPKR